MKINFEQATQIMDFVVSTGRRVAVPKFVVYDYIRVQAHQNGYSIIKQINKISVKMNEKDFKINSLARKLEKHWECLRLVAGGDDAFADFNKFEIYYKKAQELYSNQPKPEQN